MANISTFPLVSVLKTATFYSYLVNVSCKMIDQTTFSVGPSVCPQLTADLSESCFLREPCRPVISHGSLTFNRQAQAHTVNRGGWKN